MAVTKSLIYTAEDSKQNKMSAKPSIKLFLLSSDKLSRVKLIKKKRLG